MLHTDPSLGKYRYSGEHRKHKVPIQIRNTMNKDFTLNVADIDRLFFETKMPLENVRKLWVLAFEQPWESNNAHALNELYNWLKEKPETLKIEHNEWQQRLKDAQAALDKAVQSHANYFDLRSAKYALKNTEKELKSYNGKEQRIKRLQKLFDELGRKHKTALNFLHNYTPIGG